MIPETIGAFLGFLGLIAPGLVYQLRRETSRATDPETSFREASRVGLVSLALSIIALSVLAIVLGTHPAWMPDPGAWLRTGEGYFVAHYRLVVRAALVEVALACGLALLADQVVRWISPGQGQVSKTSVWFRVLRVERPRGKVPWAHVHLKSGADYYGFVGWYSAETAQADREMSLIGPDLQYRAAGAQDARTLSPGWQCVVVAATEIEYMKVDYLPAKKKTLRTREARAAPSQLTRTVRPAADQTEQ